eukprot:gene7347-25692_t
MQYVGTVILSYKQPGGGPQVQYAGDTYTMNGLPGPGNGTGVGDVQWENNLTALVWTMTGKQFDTPAPWPFLTLNTTVLYSLNTSSRAAANYNPPPYAKGDTLIIYHNGHESESCTPNYDGVVDHFNQLGYDVMELMMPLIGCNQAYQYGNPKSHQWFQQYEDRGHSKAAVWPGDIFVPPPVVGAGGDYEQNQARPMWKAVGGYLQLYILAALEEGRHQVQILHEYDSCCFRAAGLHDEIKEYNAYVQTQVNGWMQTAVTAGNYHQVNVRDKVIVAAVVERLRKKGSLAKADFANLPFDDIMVQG